jgi:hypothetical protein
MRLMPLFYSLIFVSNFLAGSFAQAGAPNSEKHTPSKSNSAQNLQLQTANEFSKLNVRKLTNQPNTFAISKPGMPVTFQIFVSHPSPGSTQFTLMGFDSKGNTAGVETFLVDPRATGQDLVELNKKMKKAITHLNYQIAQSLHLTPSESRAVGVFIGVAIAGFVMYVCLPATVVAGTTASAGASVMIGFIGLAFGFSYALNSITD